MKKLTIILTLFIIFNAGCKDDDPLCITCPKYAFLNDKGQCECLEGYKTIAKNDTFECERAVRHGSYSEFYPVNLSDCNGCLSEHFSIALTDLGQAIIGNGMEGILNIRYWIHQANVSVYRYMDHDSLYRVFNINGLKCDPRIKCIEFTGIVSRDFSEMEVRLNFYDFYFDWAFYLDPKKAISNCTFIVKNK